MCPRPFTHSLGVCLYWEVVKWCDLWCVRFMLAWESFDSLISHCVLSIDALWYENSKYSLLWPDILHHSYPLCIQHLFSLEENLLHWMGNVNMTAEVLHLPLSICAPSPSLLLSPSNCALIAPTSPGGWAQKELDINNKHLFIQIMRKLRTFGQSSTPAR